MTKPCVVFATPTYDHRVCYEFFRSSIETEWLLAAKGIPHGYIGRGGDQFIAKVRSKLATEFLRNYPMATDLFFLDDDISWPAEKVLEFIERPEDIVAGIYPKKQETRDFPVELVADSETGELIERNGLFLASGAPTGFMRIKRHVIEELAKHSGQFREQDADGVWHNHYAMFRTGLGPGGEWWGEDYCMCMNARALGFEIWVDPNIKFTHRGNKKWVDNLSEHLDVFREKAKLAAVKIEKEKRSGSELPQAKA